MKNEELKKILATLPDCLDVEVAVKGRGEDEKYMRRIVVGVERRHDNHKGKDFISLICLKSLREQYGQEREKEAYVKNLLSQAGLLQRQKDETEQIADKVRRNNQNGAEFGNPDFGNFGKATFTRTEAEQIAEATEPPTDQTRKPKPAAKTMADLTEQVKESLRQSAGQAAESDTAET